MDRRLVKSFDNLVQSTYGSQHTSESVLRDYAQNIQKAIATGAGLATPSGTPMADASALNLQNLDPVLTSVLFNEDHFELFGTLPRVPSINLNYQFDRRLRYGGGRRNAGFVEGGAPLGGTSQYERDSATIRFMGVRRGITHQLMQEGNMGGSQLDPVAEENRNGTLELLEEVERGIYFSQEAIKNSAGQTVNYDGIYQQVINSQFANRNVIDKQGASVTFEDLEDAAQLLVESYYVTSFKDIRCLASPGIIADFSKLRLNMQRQMATGRPVEPTWAGAPFEGYSSNFGNIPIKRHIFFQRVTGDAPLSAAIGPDAGAPVAPVAPTVAAASDSGLPASQLKAGTYYYLVASVNDSGESLPSPVSAAVTPTGSAQMVTVTITAVTGATSYRIYRSTSATGAGAQWIADVPDAPGAVYNDKNQKIPGSGTMMLWLNEPETIVVPQFLPLLRWPVAITTTTIEWFILLYHTVKLKAPQRFILFTNVGRLS